MRKPLLLGASVLCSLLAAVGQSSAQVASVPPQLQAAIKKVRRDAEIVRRDAIDWKSCAPPERRTLRVCMVGRLRPRAPRQRASATQATPAATTAAPARRRRRSPSPIQRLPMSAEKTMEISRPATT